MASYYYIMSFDFQNTLINLWMLSLGPALPEAIAQCYGGLEVEGFDWVRKCEEKVLVMVKEAEAPVAMGSANNGFAMEWSADKGCRPRGVRTVALSVGSITGLRSPFAFAAT
ncbi:hypothetical protein CRG98_028359 [Punica granatum]|uniref:Uncharacterized protein n=1 Tax=Punica granatum TaxID=22663 RepID=A0A2I0J5B5_PUNGR|nr:hypothetical protein CRG98_028359 [Punica granatum]